MTWFDDRRAQHPYFDVSNRVSIALDTLAATPSTPHVDAFMQLAGVVHDLRVQIDTIPAIYVPTSVLQDLHTSLLSIEEAIARYETDRVDGHATAILERSEPLVAYAARVLAFAPTEELVGEALRSAVRHLAEFQASTERQIQAAIARANEAHDQTIGAFQEAAGHVERQATEAITAISSARETTQSTFESFEARFSQQASRLDAAIGEQAQRFSGDQDVRLREFEAVLRRIDRDAGEQSEALAAEASGFISYLEERAEAARSIVAATAAASTAKRYVDAEREEGRRADQWRSIGLLILGSTVIVGLLVGIFFAPETDAGWEAFVIFYLLKTPLSALAIYIGAYALHQSGAHRSRANEAGQVARELSVFRPFIDELPNERRETEISDATKRYFRGPGASGSVESNPAPTPPSR